MEFAGPAWRAAEWDKEAVAVWRQETWPVIKRPSLTWAWLVFEDESGQA